MVEYRDKLDVARQQHAVAEHVAGHVADAGDGEVRRLRVHAHFAEVALDRFPGAARGDAHRLVVVADRAAGGERVAQPEAVLLADGVGEIGKRGGALVRRHHEVGVVRIVPLDLRRRNDFVTDTVVSQVEQARAGSPGSRRCPPS